MKAIGIIPARYGSTRLEGKPLVDIVGKPMIQHVYERASKAFECLVATDDERIYNTVKGFGGNVVMTSAQHRTGTNRCLEAYQVYKKKGTPVDVIVNVQGDEPLIDPVQLNQVLSCFNDAKTELATLAFAVTQPKELFNPSDCYLTIDDNMHALYFSRAVIPTIRGVEKHEWINYHTFYKHIGLYAYTPNALLAFAQMPTSTLEKAESLEQNRWLQSGRKIKVQLTAKPSQSVDTIEDLETVREIFQRELLA